jgi:ubiquinone/menaquinone biosynthesis C-methylase UbiE
MRNCPIVVGQQSSIERVKKMETESSYTIGHGDGPLAYMRFRSAERCCAFFRTHVRSASRILDCGCGPGSVTIGLAQWAPDGETVGVDLGAEQLDAARALARNRGVNNLTFRHGDIFDLPFGDSSFDVVFSQTVLCHIPEPEKALAEIKRVLCPGGLVALRDAITASTVIWPDEPLVRELVRVIRLAVQHSGGNPDVGRELGTLLRSAGFTDVFLTLDFEQPERPEERAAYFSLVAGLLEGDLAKLAVSQGWSTAQRLAEGVARCRELANVAGSIYGAPFGQAIGRKPS